MKLTKEEVKKRLIKLRNYERMYPRALKKRDALKAENRLLKKQLTNMGSLETEIEKLRLELEELKIMKFGEIRAKRKKSTCLPKCKGKKVKIERSRESYRRAEPKPERVTGELRLELNECPDCGAELVDKKDHIHFREDLRNLEELIKSAAEIVKTTIESGKCTNCNCRISAMEIPKQKVIIGENVRRMVVYKCILMGLSYSQVAKSLKQEYGITLSNGEVANILQGESIVLTPYYEHIVKLLEAEPAHYDETTWKTKSQGNTVSEGNYCWVKTGVETNNQIFWFGKSRGKGVAESLRGIKEGSIGVSDDYGAYDNLFEEHELCWAHPHRKLRDLAGSSQLSKKKLKICKQAFKAFRRIYKEAEQFRQDLLANKYTVKQKSEKRIGLESRFEKIQKLNPEDPIKLAAIRKRLKLKQSKYFTFIDHPFLPLDNNKAERKIRKVVLKRKKSFGSKSQKGADTLSILYSVIFTMMEENSDENFFTLYEEVAKFGTQI